MTKWNYLGSVNAGDLDYLIRQSTRLGVEWPENVRKLIEKRNAIMVALRDVEPVAATSSRSLRSSGPRRRLKPW